MSSIDSAITKIQLIVDALTSVDFKSTPDYPIENADPFPFSAAYLGGGSFTATNASVHHNFPTINVEFHFSRVNLRQTYQQVNAVAIEFPARLVADPTLGGTVETIVMSRDAPITYTVKPFAFGSVISQVMQFSIPVKLLKAPQR